MTPLAAYEPDAFDALPAFDDAQANLIEFEPKLPELARLVSSHDGDDRVGLALLHRHFDMDADELLVEELDPARRTSTASPRPRATAGAVMPHLFRATRTAAGYRWQPLEFVDISHCPDAIETYAWLQAQTALLDALAECLERTGVIDAVGLSLSHGREDVECAEGEVLVEQTDEVARTLTMRPRPTQTLGGTTTPTNWSVRDGAVLMRCTCQRDQSGSHQHFETN